MAGPQEKKHNYKLIIDPMIHQRGGQKIYRFDGIDPADNTLVSVKDPRPRYLRFWTKKIPADLPVPKFKFDHYYVGTPPPNEVTFTNLNDNINKDFLENMCKGFGKIEEVKIYYNPKNKKHMGIGKVLFTSTKNAKACAAKLNQTSKMGNIMNVFVDALGKQRQQILDEILDDGPKMPKPPSPTFDPRSGLSYAQQQALHIDHGPPLPPEPEPFNQGQVDHGLGAPPPIQGNPYLPPPNLPPPNDYDQTPSDFSYSTNHSDTGYSGSSFGRNQFQNNGPFSGNFDPRNQSGQFDFGGNRSQIPPPQSPFVKPPPGGQFGNTPHSYDSGMSQHTPMTPQTPHPQTPHQMTPKNQTPRPSMQNDHDRSFDNRDRGGRNRDRRDWDRGNDRNRHKNNDWNRDRDRYNRDNRDRDKGRRDWKYERDRDSRDNEYSRRERERERERERNRNNERDRRRNDFRDSRNDERENSREKLPVVEKEIPKEEPYIEPYVEPFVPPAPIKPPTPPPPTFTPKPAEPKEDDEPRSMSLESRIQSLLSGFRSPEPAKPQLKEESPSPSTPKGLPPSENAQSGFEKSDSGTDLVSMNKNGGTPLYNQNLNEHSASGHDSNHGWPNNYPNGPMPVNSQISQDDEDRMSLDSNESGGGNASIEINPTAIKPDINMPPPLMSIPVKPPNWPASSANSFDLGGFPPPQNANINSFDYMSGPYNQNYMNQFNNDLNNAEIEMSEEISEFQREKEQRVERTFDSVLEDFVEELKEILMKDLCKKMVENCGYREYDRWWDKEEAKRKPQKPLLLDRRDRDKKDNQKPPEKSEVVSSTLAGLFAQPEKPRHPWSKDGGFDIGAAYGGQTGGFGGGFLGIRGGMPRMPSFKKKKTEEEIAREERREKRRKEKEERRKEKEERKKQKEKEEEEKAKEEAATEVKRKSKPVIYESSSSEEEEEEEEEEEAQASDEEEESAEESSEAESSADDEDDDDDDDEDESDSDSSAAESSEAETEKHGESEDEIVDVESESKKGDSNDEDEKSIKVVSSSSSSAASSSSSSESEEEEEGEKEEGEEEIEDLKKETQAERISPEKEKAKQKSPEKVSKTPDKSVPPDRSEEEMETEELEKSVIEALSPKKNQTVKTPTKERNLFDNLTSERQLSGLSLLSEAAALSLEELNKETVQETGLTQEEEEKRKWEEARPSFLSEHAYYAMPQQEDDNESTATLSADEEEDPAQSVILDHSYALQPTPEILEQMRVDHERSMELAREIERQAAEERKRMEKREKLEKEKLEKQVPEKGKRGRKRKVTNDTLLDITNKENKVHRELMNLLEPVKPKPVVKYKPRTFEEERQAFFHIFNHGIDTEDVQYLKKCYETLLQTDDPMFYWLNDILWVDHTITNIPDPVPPKRRRKNEMEFMPPKHKTGCARTEGYYKLSMREKAQYLQGAYNQQLAAEKAKQLESGASKTAQQQAQQASRVARHDNRRLQTTYADLDLGELLRFNQLKFRIKALKFAKSGIHDWGLFALEPIARDEMVIEYVGMTLRQTVADLREKQYESKGIGSSYLFRIDHETIIDATKMGNLARFINHSCNPNCYAKVIPVEGKKKIVIYSKKDIDVNEEITYDYKFPIEDDKIPCLCGSSNCRGTLN